MYLGNLSLRKLFDIFVTNYVPTGAEADQLRISLENDERNIQDADLRISSLELQLKEQRARRIAFMESARMKRAVFAPVRKLSSEILGEIFEWCNDVGIGAINPKRSEWCYGVGVERDVPTGWITSQSSPLVLAHICRRWRLVALGTPRLWNTLAVHSAFTKNASLIPFWLRNSGSTALDIFVLGHHHGGIQWISENLHRCRTLYLDGDLDLGKIILPRTITNTPFLHNLWIGRSPYSENTIPTIHYSECGSVVAPNILSLEIYVLPLLLRLIPMPSTFLHLRQLTIEWEGQDDITGVLRNLHTPALEFLSLLTTEPEEDLDLAAIVRDFISSSAPPLRELHLMELWGTDAIVDLLPHLEILFTNGYDIKEGLGGALTPEADKHPSTWELPRLSLLHLHSAIFDEGYGIVEMVRSRLSRYPPDKGDLDGSKRLTRLEISAYYLEPENLDALERLCDEFDWFSFAYTPPDYGHIPH